ncbi:MAG: glycosyltransferase family 4 protein [Terracidiphilus sp.]|nr:glycosyltransferase family 4 protein [Terracidiphilus sp.]
MGVTSAQTCLVLKGRLRALREAGFRVTLVSSPGKLLDDLARDEGVERVDVPMVRTIAPLRDAFALVRLCLCLVRLRPDVVEFSTPKAGLLGMVAARLTRVPRRVYMLRGLKLEATRGPKRAVLHAAERLTMACAHTVLCNSPSLRDTALRLRLTRADKLCLLGPGSSIGVDVSHFSPGDNNIRRKLNIPEDALVIGYVGRLTRDKGLPELIAAFDAVLRAVPDACLLLVGWWDQSEDAMSSAQREKILNHHRIRFTGFVEDTAAYYRAMDVFVLPTLREGFPNVALEAAATALPVLTTEATGARDAIVAGVTGLLVRPGSVQEIEEGLLALLRDAGMRQRMGAAGRQWVKQRFAREEVLAANVRFYLGLFAELSGRHREDRAAAD